MCCPDLSFCLVEEEAPEFTQESEYAFDALGIPGFALFDGAEEHLVHAERIGAVPGNEVVWIDGVVEAFAHLFRFRAAEVFTFFEDEFGIGIFGAPFFKCVEVEFSPIYNVDVDVDRGGRDRFKLDAGII